MIPITPNLSQNNSSNISSEQIVLQKVVLQNQLKQNHVEVLKKILTFFHENFESLFGSTLRRTEYIKGRIFTKYGNYYSKIINSKENKLNDQQLLKYCSEFIAELYSDKIKFNFDENKKIILNESGEFIEGISFEKKEFELQVTNEKFYIFHYWKTNFEFESNGKVNIAKLRLDYIKKTANLIYKSNNDPGNSSTGKIIEANSATGGKIIKIVFSDSSENPLSMVISFFLPQVLDLQENIWASYTKERKEKRGSMVTGSAYLKRFDNIKAWENYFTEPPVLDNGVYAYLINNRIDLPQTSPDNISGLGNISTSLSNFEGVYRGNLIHHENEMDSSFNNFIIVLKGNGKVIIYTARAQELPHTIYVGYYRVISRESSKILIIDYDYNKLEPSRFSHFSKYYNFRLVLRKEGNHGLLGTRIAINKSTNTPIVARLALNKLDTQINVDDFFSTSKETVKAFLSEEGNLEEIPIFKLGKINPDILLFFQNENNSFLANFFLGKGKFFSYSDSNILNLIANSLPENHIDFAINGEFECYSFTLRGNKRIFQYTIEEAVFLMYPLKIEKDGNVFIKVGSNIHQGRAYFNSDKKELLINFTNSIFLSAIFTLLEFEGNFYSDRISGTLIKNTNVGGNPEGRVCVLIKKENAYSNNVHKKSEDIPFDSSNFIFIDKETNGALSYLAGPVNRIARGVNDGKDTTQVRGNSSFKKDMFYAACYLAQKKNPDVNAVKKRLLQCYLHGFAQTFHKGIEIEKSDDTAFQKLRDERKELLDAMNNGPLKSEVFKKYIEELWLNDKSANKLNRIFGCEQQEKIFIIKPNFQDDKLAGRATLFAKNDESTIEIIKNLFTNSRLNSPVVIEHDDKSLKVESNQKLHYIIIGLFSNEMTVKINNFSRSVCNRYFILEKDKNEDTECHKIIIAGFDKSNSVSNVEKWTTYQLDERSIYADFFIISKVDYLDNKAIICGGLKKEGTIKAGEYLKENWENLYDLKDVKTNLSIQDGRNFVCLFGVLKTTLEVKLLEIRVL